MRPGIGLDEEQAKQLALAACQGASWSNKKFRKFFADFVSRDQLAGKDRVFMVPENLCPSSGEDLSKALDRIYRIRSGNLHSASPFPKSVGVGTSPWIKWRHYP